jgi:hypothetical protein
MSQPKPGDRFSFTYIDEEGSQPHQAIVQRILSNREEGLSSPEADFYVAEWLDALLLNPDSTPAAPTRPFTMMLSADCKTTIDGRPVSVTFEDAPS